MKTAKFIISSNPIINDGRVFITHMQYPIIIAEAIHFNINQENDWIDCKNKFNIVTTIDYPSELIVLGAIYIENDSDKLNKIMNRMGDWYYNFLTWKSKSHL